MTPPALPPHLRLRLALGRKDILGPGKAELMEHIRATGSISAAGRAMHMSYRRAWLLVEDLNRLFDAPLVDTARGGAGGGGARLTSLGEEVLQRFRAIEAAAERAAASDLLALSRRLAAQAQANPSGDEPQ